MRCEVTFNVFPCFEGKELAAIISGDAVEGGAFLDSLVEYVEVLKEEDGVGLLLVELHVREEHLEGSLMGDLWVFALEGVDEDQMGQAVLQRSLSSGTFQSVMMERSLALSNWELTPKPPQQRLSHPNIKLLSKHHTHQNNNHPPIPIRYSEQHTPIIHRIKQPPSSQRLVLSISQQNICYSYWRTNKKSILKLISRRYAQQNKQMNFVVRRYFSNSHFIKNLLEKEIIPLRKQKLTDLRKIHGERVIAKVKVDDAVLGMRGLPVMFYDGSSLDPISGITFRGHSIPEFCERAQKAPGGSQPLPQAMFFLLLTGRYPTDEQLKLLLVNWQRRGDLSHADTAFITSLPRDFHPMTMLSMSLLHQQAHSKFFKAYQGGVNKAKYWEYYFEDSMDLLAKLPHICATIYRHKYHNSQLIAADHNLDWAGNFGHMLGFQDFQMKECLRGYISIHADHEGGNVSAHTSHLVGSALADPYLSFSAAINGLAGPLHGLANQECLKWLTELKEYHKGEKPSAKIIEEYVRKTLGEGKVIPGYGHAVLRNTDPRFVHLKNFADKNIKDDYICDLARQCFDTIPKILGTVGKIKNPWPNVDAFSGALLQHYGLDQHEFFTVVFGVSRALGCLANGIWARAFGLPIERPNSIDIAFLEGLESDPQD